MTAKVIKDNSQEAKFVALLREADREAVKLFVEEYRPRIFSFVFSLLMNKEDSEDVTQETLIKVLRSIGRFKGDSSLTTWIFRIARNTAVDLKRKSIRGDQCVKSFRDVATAQEAPLQNKPDIVYQTKEEFGRVARILTGLTPEHREVVVLREVEGLSYDEIAEATGITRGTVMSRLFYARKKIQEALVGDGDVEGGDLETLPIKKSKLKVVGKSL